MNAIAPDQMDEAVTRSLDELGDWLWPATCALPAAVISRVQRLWMDTSACAYAGLRAAEPAALAADQAASDPGHVPLPGSQHLVGAQAAAGLMALAACWDEACEGAAVAHGRPGVPVIAALWTQLAGRRVSWSAVWRATVIGYEVGARMGAFLRIRPGMHVDGVWGAFGAAAAVVSLRGGDWAQVLRALQACATQLPFSLYQPIRQGANVRNTYLAHSAWLGLQAAQWTCAGLAMPVGTVSEYRTLALDGAGHGHWPAPGQWLTLDSYWKPFAAVRHVHYGAQAALRLRAQWLAQGLRVVDIEEIELCVYPEALQYCGNRAPETVLAAQFSLSHGVACALVHGDLGPAQFRAPQFMDEAVRKLEARVRVRVDAQAFPGAARGAHLCIAGAGASLSVRQDSVTGDAGHEPDPQAVLDKFHRDTGGNEAMRHWARSLSEAGPDAMACLPRSGA